MKRAAFTVVELLAATAVFLLLLLVVVAATTQTGATWRYTTARAEQFREARNGFETVTRRLSEATLNTYWDYDNPTNPTRYERRSELRFIAGPATTLLGSTPAAQRVTHAVFFHAPLGFTVSSPGPAGPRYDGLDQLLNAWGYFVELSDDAALRPPFLNGGALPLRHRFRLMEAMLPAEQLRTYHYTSGGSPQAPASIGYRGLGWITDWVNAPAAPRRLLAENIVALILTPRLARAEEQAFGPAGDRSPLAPAYLYDSSATAADPRLNPRNQLPPVVQVTMVAIDETSASRLNLTAASADPLRLAGKFQDTARFSRDLALDPRRGPGDSLENQLLSLRADYRVFSSAVPIRAAKWSREQAN